MNVAGPSYLGEDFTNAPPGHRFSLYFQYWTPGDWSACSTSKMKAMDKVVTLPPESVKQIEAINRRQAALVERLPEDDRLTMLARLLSPLTTGMGMSHPLENGFAFLSPYGIPYLPGSSIKGVLRRAAQDLVQEGEWKPEWINSLFGYSAEESGGDSRAGACSFFDVIPEIFSDKLAVEVMTPHYAGYYQGKQSPSDMEQPNPIPFLVIPDRSSFTFQVTCVRSRLDPELQDGQWKSVIEQALLYAFDWLGFGAKTALGYGALTPDRERARELEQQRRKELERIEKEKREQERLATLSPLEKEIETLIAESARPAKEGYLVIIKALGEGHWPDSTVASQVADWVRRQMVDMKCWVEQSKKKNPAKDKNHQRTLEVKKYL